MLQPTRSFRKLSISARQDIFDLFTGQYLSVFKGQGLDYEESRYYHEGDNVRDIDWTTSARTGELFVKIYRESREINALFAVDTSSSARWAISGVSPAELSMSAMLWLAAVVNRNNDKLGAYIFSDTVKKIPFTKGTPHTISTLNEIEQEYYKDSVFHKENFEIFLQNLLAGVRSKTICFLCTDSNEVANPGVQKHLKVLNKKHQVVLIRSSHSLSSLEKLQGSERFQDIETGQEKVMRFRKKDMQKLHVAYQQVGKDIQAFCRKNRMGYVALNEHSDVLYELVQCMRELKRTRQFMYK